MKNAHPVPPGIGYCPLKAKIKILHYVFRLFYVIEVVVEHFVPVLRVLGGEVVAGADEEEVTHHVPDHCLVEVAVINMLPVRVLKWSLRME